MPRRGTAERGPPGDDGPMSVGLGPPQVSPDGKWIWDGPKWLPIPPAEAGEPAAAIGYPAPAPEPVAAVYSPAEMNPPLWQQPAAPTQLGPHPVRAARAVALLPRGGG